MLMRPLSDLKCMVFNRWQMHLECVHLRFAGLISAQAGQEWKQGKGWYLVLQLFTGMFRDLK